MRLTGMNGFAVLGPKSVSQNRATLGSAVPSTLGTIGGGRVVEARDGSAGKVDLERLGRCASYLENPCAGEALVRELDSRNAIGRSTPLPGSTSLAMIPNGRVNPARAACFPAAT